jgi:hypothetical protein
MRPGKCRAWWTQHRVLTATLMIGSLASAFYSFGMAGQRRGEHTAVQAATGSRSETLDYYSANKTPANFAAWKAKYNFPEQAPGEGRDHFVERTGIVVYYNKSTLGLGRELGCSRFTGATGAGVACYVTNYGQKFQDPSRALADAVAGVDPKGRETCVHTQVPALASKLRPAGPSRSSYEVQFAAYGANGTLTDFAQLDAMGARPVPVICTTCHGGTYDPHTRVVSGGGSTPIKPAHLTFSTKPGYTYEDQKKRIDALNAEMANFP